MRGDLGYFAILAKIACQVASEAPDGEDGPAWKKVIERFLFDRIGGDPGEHTVAFRKQGPLPVHPGVALSVVVRRKDTLVRTEGTLHCEFIPVGIV